MTLRNDRTLLNRLIWLHGVGVIGGGSSGVVVTVDGVSPLSLPNAKADLLRSLIQRGKCVVENGMIKCNNGAISLHDDELPDGYRRLLSMSMNNNCYYVVPDFHLTGADTLRFSYSVIANCGVIGSYVASGSANYSLYTTTNSTKYLRYAGSSYWGYSTANKRYDVAITPTGSKGFEVDSTWEEVDFTTPNPLCIGATMENTTTSPIMKGTFYGNVEVESSAGSLRFKGIPCERVSDGEIGWYDTVSETFFEPVGTTPTAGGYDYSHIARTVTGTLEVITATSGDTAGAVDLLAVGSIADTQDIISGEVTRRTEVILYDGTQDVCQPYLGTLDVGAIVVHAPGTEYSGNVATFDAEEETPINAAIISMEPVQDLHGYDKPWAGGAGKNLFDKSAVNLGYRIYINGNLYADADYFASDYIPVAVGETYVKNSPSADAYHRFCTYTSEKVFVRKVDDRNMVTIGSTEAYIRFCGLQTELDTTQIEPGSVSTSYAPYSNECPITGWIGATLTKSGKNLVDVADVSGIASQTQIGAVILPAGNYAMSANISNSGSAGAGVRITRSDNTTIKSIGFSSSPTASRYSGTFTLTEETSCKIFVVGTAAGYNASVSDVQVEVGSTATDWEPYVAATDYRKEFPVLAGTVYGGTLDIANGTLTVDRVMRNGTDWRTVSKSSTGNGFYGRIYLDGDYLRKSSSDIYKCLGNLMPVASGAAYDWHANVAGTIGSPTQYLHIYVPFSALPEYQDGDNAMALFKARYDATAFRFVLPIEPIIYQLTPQQIDTLVGGNVFSSNAGDVSIWVQDAPTTESAAPQALRLTAGDNTLTVTAEVSGIELEAEYMAAN